MAKKNQKAEEATVPVEKVQELVENNPAPGQQQAPPAQAAKSSSSKCRLS